MAATPPMPPGSKSYPLNGTSSSSSSNNNNSPAEGNTKGRSSNNNISDAINQHFLKKREAPATRQRSRCGSYEQLELLDHPQPAAGAAPAEAEAEAGRKPSTNCNCTNISIMHLFHEMKQEFPTIPDAIVTQCVSENCHQRENCIHMLKKELALHPIPVQSYPAKVLQQQQQQQQQQQRQAKPPTPLKPLRVAPTQPPEPSLNGNGNGDASPSPTHSPSPQPRPRPTTLNLQRQLNAQLQQKIQQRQQRQQRDQQPPQLTPTSLNKPLRRAPGLPPPPGPPLAPKPSFSNDSSCLTSPMSSSESEFSLNAVSLSSPTSATRAAAATATAAAAATTPQQPSPVRHRSVINLQPELPYARDFLSNSSALSPALTPPTLPGSPGSASAVSPGRKSFTSLNLTLRQPTGGAQSAIDITAGPAPSGQGSGITYSSVSFDARRGTHKNFQLTVTDEGSVFSAGCIRPQAPYAACEPQQQTAVPPARQPPPAAAAASLLSTDGLSPDCDMPEVFPYPTQAQNHVVASNYITNHAADSSSGNNNNNGSSSNDSSPVSMPLYAGVLEECDPEARAATIERQKQRRDKLANVLRNNKKRLLVLEQEINILTEPVPVGESERLDRDIKQLTEDCQRLLNLINDPQANGSGPAPNSMNRQHSAPANNNQQQQQLQQQPQPFPRQRQAGRSQAPPGSLRLHSVPAQPTSQPGPDFVQHHSSAPTSACLTPQQQQQLQLQQEPPPTYAQYYQFQQYLQQQRQQQRQQQLQQFQLQQQQAHQPHQPQQQQHQQQHQQQQQMPVQRSATDEEEYLSDSDVDEDEEPLDMWACNMCTFRNHPQLNICEACENVRIQPAPVLSREDIHITLSPGENRIIHSWILS